MFGYVTVNPAELDEAQKARFAAYYCGLCRRLRADHGVMGRMTLTYDMTFLTVLLTSLYDEETKSGRGRCPAHPAKQRAWTVSAITDYAAAMNCYLAARKLDDDWRDDRNLLARAGERLLRGTCGEIARAWPRQCRAIDEGLRALAALEAQNCQVIDLPARRFGELTGELFVLREDLWSEALRALGRALGGFIYVMDALEDLNSDVRRGRYNPLSSMRDEPDLQSGCREMLTLLMARCTDAFEQLPIVEDAALLRNILYSGVWTRYERLWHGQTGGGK